MSSSVLPSEKSSGRFFAPKSVERSKNWRSWWESWFAVYVDSPSKCQALILAVWGKTPRFHCTTMVTYHGTQIMVSLITALIFIKQNSYVVLKLKLTLFLNLLKTWYIMVCFCFVSSAFWTLPRYTTNLPSLMDCIPSLCSDL